MNTITPLEYDNLNNGHYKVIWKEGISFFKIIGKRDAFYYDVYVYYNNNTFINTTCTNFKSEYRLNNKHEIYVFKDEDELLRELVMEII